MQCFSVSIIVIPRHLVAWSLIKLRIQLDLQITWYSVDLDTACSKAFFVISNNSAHDEIHDKFEYLWKETSQKLIRKTFVKIYCWFNFDFVHTRGGAFMLYPDYYSGISISIEKKCTICYISTHKYKIGPTCLV